MPLKRWSGRGACRSGRRKTADRQDTRTQGPARQYAILLRQRLHRHRDSVSDVDRQDELRFVWMFRHNRGSTWERYSTKIAGRDTDPHELSGATRAKFAACCQYVSKSAVQALNRNAFFPPIRPLSISSAINLTEFRAQAAGATVAITALGLSSVGMGISRVTSRRLSMTRRCL